MESFFGHDFSQVRVHDDSRAGESAAAVNAHAYTLGAHLVFAPGRYAPDTEAGTRLLAHELTHSVQQGPGMSFDAARPPLVGAASSPAEDAADRVAGSWPGAAAEPGRFAPTLQRLAGGPVIQRMIACPSHLDDRDPVPSGWRAYPGPTGVFHCGFRTILEDRAPTPDDPMNECVYDHSGVLVDENHAYAGCRGTPDQYDSRVDPIRHTLIDTGGILMAGAPAFFTSRVYDIVTAISAAVAAVQAAGQVIRSVGEGLARVVALGVLTAVATSDPGNWTFQGLPARSVRHLNVMGAVLSSAAFAGNVDMLLQNLTRRLDSFPIGNLLDELAADINSGLRAQQPASPLVSASALGELTLPQLVEFLRVNGLLSYRRPPEDVARDQLAAQTATPAQP